MMSYACVRACACMHARACACMRMHVHVWKVTLSPLPTPIHPPPHPPGGTPKISQNSIALELIKIFQFRLKI